jgi:diguanylate cyclase (GGDEF)-like protein
VDENLTEEKLAELSKKTSFGDVLTRLYKKIIDEDIRLYGKIIDTVNRDHEAPEQQNLFNEELSRKKMRELLTVHRTRPDDDGLTSEVTFITSAVWVDPSGPEEEPEIIGWDIPTRYDHYMKAIYYDQLTDVYNKKAYLEFLTDVISQAYKKKKNVAYIYIDINGFKKINDEDPSHHHVGDMILKAFGRRIKAGLREKVDDNGMFRETDAVYRFGGDEFVIVLGDIETEAEAEAVWDRIDKAICQKVTIDNKEYSITASRGLFLYRPDIDGELSLEEIQKIADTKMYADKRKKKSVWHRFIRFLGLPD